MVVSDRQYPANAVCQCTMHRPNLTQNSNHLRYCGYVLLRVAFVALQSVSCTLAVRGAIHPYSACDA